MPYIPIHQAQLGRGVPVPGRTQGSRDCGPRSWQMGMDAQSRGRVRPTISELRKRGRVPGPQPTSILDAKRAIDGYPVPGRRPLRYYVKRRVAEVNRAVQRGRPVHLGISYGAWNRSQRKRTGDPNFRGGHSILVFGERRRGAGIEWLVFDPLEDGRRTEISRGATWRLRQDVIDAAVRFAGGDRERIWAGVIGGGYAR